VRVGDLAVADHPAGLRTLAAGHEFDVIGQEDMALDVPHPSQQVLASPA
jgi:hypothetical protein